MAEWSNAAVLKTVGRSRGPGVRIPLSPQRNIKPFLGLFYFGEDEIKFSLAWLRQNKKYTPQVWLNIALLPPPADHVSNPGIKSPCSKYMAL